MKKNFYTLDKDLLNSFPASTLKAFITLDSQVKYFETQGWLKNGYASLNLQVSSKKIGCSVAQLDEFIDELIEQGLIETKLIGNTTYFKIADSHASPIPLEPCTNNHDNINHGLYNNNNLNNNHGYINNNHGLKEKIYKKENNHGYSTNTSNNINNNGYADTSVNIDSIEEELKNAFDRIQKGYTKADACVEAKKFQPTFNKFKEMNDPQINKMLENFKEKVNMVFNEKQKPQTEQKYINLIETLAV